MNASYALVLALAIGQVESPEPDSSVGQKLATDAVRAGYVRIGVLPRFLIRQGNQETLGGSVGPQAELWAERLEEELVGLAQGRFKIVDGKRMAAGLKDMTIADLGDRQSLSKLAERVGGLDAIVVGSVLDARGAKSDDPGQMQVRCRLVAVRDGTLASATHQDVTVTLSDAAYMGESWELRRWTAQGLVNLGIRPDDGIASSPFGIGTFYEQEQYKLIRRDRPHPLADAQCPFQLEVFVESQKRPFVAIGEKMYVALEPGETYELRGRNGCPRDVYLAVFVDGINTLGKKREHPSQCRYWHVNAGKGFRLGGWMTGADGQYREEAFVVSPGDDSVAVGQGFGQSLGQITAVFFTIGMDGIPKAPEIHPMMTLGTFGTGAGASRRLTLEEKRGQKPGLILAAVTFYYRTESQVEQLRK